MMLWISMGMQTLIGVGMCLLAWNGLTGAEQARKAEDWAWARHLLALATIWAAAAGVTAVILIGEMR